MATFENLIREQFNSRVSFIDKGNGIVQLIAPFFYADGDVMNIYLQILENNLIRISDLGFTLMRLSYTYEINTAHREKLLLQTIQDNFGQYDEGLIYIDVRPQNLYAGVNRFSSIVAKVMNLDILQNTKTQNTFIHEFNQFCIEQLKDFSPIPNCRPLNDELEVDFYIENPHGKPLYLFGVKSKDKARETVINCLQFRQSLKFRSLIIHDDATKLSSYDQSQLMKVADKQFPDLDDFRKNAYDYIHEECA